MAECSPKRMVVANFCLDGLDLKKLEIVNKCGLGIECPITPNESL